MDDIMVEEVDCHGFVQEFCDSDYGKVGEQCLTKGIDDF